LNRIICAWIGTCAALAAAGDMGKYASHVQICASNFYFAHNCCPNLTPHSQYIRDECCLALKMKS
jgi:hypothetical protein